MRIQALQLLQQTNGVDCATVLAALGEALADEDTVVKIYAIQALADQGDADALTYLGRASRDADPSVQMLAIESIVQIDHGLTLLAGGATGRGSGKVGLPRPFQPARAGGAGCWRSR
jgi:hypothetical protein